MRLDLPHDIPRPRRQETPLQPSPLESRLERLAERAAENRGPEAPPRRRQTIDHPHKLERSRAKNLPHDLPHDRRTRRCELPMQIIGLALREEERRVLADVGRFRVIATRDLGDAVYDGRDSRLARDLNYLEAKGLVSINAVNARRDGRGGRVERLEVVTLTPSGRALALRSADLPVDQKLYSGLVKPREVEHDAQIYRAYRKEAERIESRGGSNLRVRLDFELKARVQREIYIARKSDPSRSMDSIKAEVAQRLQLPFVDGGIQIPDARIDYELDQGSLSGHSDIEVVTAAYHAGHLHAKVQAGFALYASTGDRATICARAEGEHHLLDSIMEL